MPAHAFRRPLAIVVALGLVLLTPAAPLRAGSAPTLAGRVLAEDGVASRPGVVVALVDTSAETIYRSQPTDERGAFRVDAPTAGKYAVVVEAPEGAFLASDGLTLAPGLNRPVSLALKPGRAGEAPAAGNAPPPKGGLPKWAKWVIAGGIVVGGAIVIDAVTKNDSEASLAN